MPVGAHMLLSFLAEPLKEKDTLLSSDDPDVSENLHEFEDWVTFLPIFIAIIIILMLSKLLEYSES